MKAAGHIGRRWGVLLALAIVIAGCGGGIPGDAVVSVDGKSISKTSFNHWMNVAAALSAASAAAKPIVPDPPKFTACIAHTAAQSEATKGAKTPTQKELKSQCEAQYKSLQQQVLGFLISSTWVLGEASALGVKVGDEEVQKDYEKIERQQYPKAGELYKYLSTSGQNVSDMLLRVKGDLLASKIQQKIVKERSKVTQAEIAKYYKEDPKRFGVAEKRDLLVILTRTEAQANKAKQEIESGKSFASLAKRISIDPTSKKNGGELPNVTQGEETKALDTAVFSAKQGILTGPIYTPFGYYIFEVKKTTPGSQQTLEQAEASIKSVLTASQQQTTLSKFAKEFKKKWTAKTECRTGYVMEDCKGYKAPKATSTSPPGVAAPTATATTPTRSVKAASTRSASTASSPSSSSVKQGDSSSSNPSAARANVICTRRNQKLGSSVPLGASLRQIVSTAAHRAAIQQRALGELEKLSAPTPRALGSNWRLMLADTRLAVLRTWALARRKGASDATLRGEVALLNRPQLSLKVTARSVGAPQCAFVVGPSAPRLSRLGAPSSKR